ncbi:MAG: hypothetical protein GY807_07275 [Gammaproteobacteria bacterium]|nr:hypothetical protein [Gammaproteobacteria bacterium]
MHWDFVSEVGGRELNPNAAIAVSLWDLFRFRPQTGGDFTNAQRILSPGGEQVFYAGDAELPLSTGGPAADNGDGQQASHWKDDDQTGVYVGVMDPTIGKGFRVTVSQNDRLALDAMGYTLVTGIDDGSFENSIGPISGGTAFYINRLTPKAYPATLTQVLVQFTNSSNVSTGSALNILVGTNQNGESDIDSTQFQSTSATISELDDFNGFDVPDVTIDSGDFIVGFSMTTDQDIFPGALDTTTYQQRSYFSGDGIDFELIDIASDGTLSGNFGIRARINR